MTLPNTPDYGRENPIAVKVISGGGGGGGGSTSPADIAAGINLSTDIDTLLDTGTSILSSVDGLESNTFGIISFTEAIDSTCISINSKILDSNALITTSNTTLGEIDTNLVNLSGKLPDTIGTKLSSLSFPVVLASDQVALPININNIGSGATEATLQQIATNTPAKTFGNNSFTIRNSQASVVANFSSSGNTRLRLVRGHAAAAVTYYIAIGTGTYISGTSLSTYALKISGGVTVSESLSDWGEVPYPIIATAGTNIWIVKAISIDPTVTQTVGGLSAFIAFDT